MGSPANTKPRTQGTSRRGFFRRSGSAAVALASVAALPLASAAAPSGPLFQHGVASGDPMSDRVILWTRVTPQSPRSVVVLRYEIAVDPLFKRVVQRGTARTDASRDHTVKVDPTGLRAATTYYYRFHAENETSPIGRTRTLPVGATPRLRLAVVSCSNHVAG